MSIYTGSRIGIDLLDGTRILGTIDGWSKEEIWVVPDGELYRILDIPRDLCRRIFVLLGDINE